MAQIQDFAFIGVRNVLVKNKKTKSVVCELPYLVGFNLSDEQDIEYLRGGFERLKLLPFKGERETSITVTTATSSPDLLKLQLNTDFETKTMNFDKTENISGEQGVFTLTEEPTASLPIAVYAIDAQGSKTELALAEGDEPEEGEYKIEGTTITCASTVEKIRAIYSVQEEAQIMEVKNVETAVYEVSGIVVAQEVGTGALYDVQIDIPSAVIQLNNSLDASNEGGVPDNIEFTIDMLADSTSDYIYRLAFKEQI